MKIASYNEIEAHAISERPARMCEICSERLGDSPFVYYFEDGEALYGDVCYECSNGQSIDDLAVRLLGILIEKNKIQIEVIQWLIEY